MGKEVVNRLNLERSKIRGADGVSQSATRRTLGRVSRGVLSTESIGRGLALLDPYRVAPIVVGGIYGLAKIVEGNTREEEAAFASVMEIAEIVALWACIEKTQIVRSQPARLEGYFESLCRKIVEMYEAIIVLLKAFISHRNSNWSKIKQHLRVS